MEDSDAAAQQRLRSALAEAMAEPAYSLAPPVSPRASAYYLSGGSASSPSSWPHVSPLAAAAGGGGGGAEAGLGAKGGGGGGRDVSQDMSQDTPSMSTRDRHQLSKRQML